MQIDLLKNYLISLIRTAVPMLVGGITSWLAAKGVHLNDDGQGLVRMVLEGTFGMFYYLVVRALEHVNYRFGWLLGYAKMPTYVVLPATATTTPSVIGGEPTQ